METRTAYDLWSSQYDDNTNKTRDLEATALRDTLKGYSFEKCLETGCGTGKNTEWLLGKAKQVTAIDLSENMLVKARQKISSDRVLFKQADLTAAWDFIDGHYDLVVFSLVLEHIFNLDHIFAQAAASLATGGHVYVGELHPFKQYTGTKARFDTEDGTQIVDCYNHNISDFVIAAKKSGLSLVDLNEYFDGGDRTSLPRILVLILKKT